MRTRSRRPGRPSPGDRRWRAAESLTWDVNALLTNYLRHFPDTQISSGQLPMFVPIAEGGYGYDHTAGTPRGRRIPPFYL
ncbi:hypothetical protein H1V43_35650 [Streptomyces sp. PSKA54]|uniref:Uncharacterized protein n=1 Tax=Streptomyces himalayensis subsp. aureolus TaxID=2758039 RepID=A0A7W2HK63_9ACTN|nr:hypothetical protein [Streptomyces himalayensis]MBA4866549.1 hypothetical protein [Streptomyces himalayensis subsp. aureolus]